MAYEVEKLEKVLSIIPSSRYKLYMPHYINSPSREDMRINNLVVDGQYVEPECGTTMCLAGHMAHEYLKELVEKGEDVSDIEFFSLTARQMALAYVGVLHSHPMYVSYSCRFHNVFNQLHIKTVRGLRGALKRQGLLP